ncbi:MAG: lipase maturation factor family protein [Myxococcales bacterium]|nr:lipase maturation factor family protein [Myxococcales bacterium]
MRVANVYHLFGHITRERIEPQFEVEVDGEFHELDLRFKPGDPGRAPPYVAPHQPRVDFRLWFYGPSFRRAMPAYLDRLLELLCRRPTQLSKLFSRLPPTGASAVRVAFYRYRFTTPEERAASGDYFERTRLGALSPRRCTTIR